MKEKLIKLNKEIWDLVGKFTEKEKINIESISMDVEDSEYTVYSGLDNKIINISNPI